MLILAISRSARMDCSNVLAWSQRTELWGIRRSLALSEFLCADRAGPSTAVSAPVSMMIRNRYCTGGLIYLCSISGTAGL